MARRGPPSARVYITTIIVRWFRFLPGLLVKSLLTRFWLSPVSRGVIEGIGMVLVAAISILPLIVFLVPLPSESLLSLVTEVGIVLVLAYAVEAAWLVPRLAQEDDYENRLGAISGIGIAGMVGVVCALLLSAHRAAGHGNGLDYLGLAFVIASLGFLAGIVVAQPLLVHEWEPPKNDR